MRKMIDDNAIPLSEVVEFHPDILLEDWLPALAIRAMSTSDESAGRSQVHVKSAPLAEDANTVFTWELTRDEISRYRNSYQDPVVTEYAAIVLSALILMRTVGKPITEVTARGENTADFWLGDREAILEVSGQTSGSTESLYLKKREQLLRSVGERYGYVCVSSFHRQESMIGREIIP